MAHASGGSPRARWQVALATTLALAALVLAGCGSAPPRSPSGTGSVPGVTPRSGAAPWYERDGAESRPPSDLSGIPDAEPRIEPIRNAGPNKPYEALGHDYVPFTDDRPYSERGLASWYGKKFHGRKTASGETYNMYAMTAAHPTLPIPSYVRILNPANQREVIVRVNDRGPFHRGRIIDLSYTAAYKLGLLKGVAPVEITRITQDDIRTGAWRKDAAPPDPARVAPPAVEVAQAPPPTVLPQAPPPAVLPQAPPPAMLPQAPAPTVLAQAPSSGAFPADAAPIASAPSGGDDPPPSPMAKPARGFWVQLGAFRQREGADSFQRRVVADLDWLAPLLGVFSEPTGFRLQAGPYASRDEALGVAQRVREALSLVPVIVERR
jgi:rare lipoprotein A